MVGAKLDATEGETSSRQDVQSWHKGGWLLQQPLSSAQHTTTHQTTLLSSSSTDSSSTASSLFTPSSLPTPQPPVNPPRKRTGAPRRRRRGLPQHPLPIGPPAKPTSATTATANTTAAATATPASTPSINVFALCTPPYRAFFPGEISILATLENHIEHALRGQAVWIRILYHIPRSINLTERQRQRVGDAQRDFDGVVLGGHSLSGGGEGVVKEERKEEEGKGKKKTGERVASPMNPNAATYKPGAVGDAASSSSSGYSSAESGTQTASTRAQSFPWGGQAPLRVSVFTLPPLNVMATPETTRLAHRMLGEINAVLEEVRGQVVRVRFAAQDREMLRLVME